MMLLMSRLAETGPFDAGGELSRGAGAALESEARQNEGQEVKAPQQYGQRRRFEER
jgi:hypothetical protein